jgi:RNA polymerase sigma factor (sigma-70 family)
VAREVSLSAADVIATGDHSLECQLPQPIDGLLRAEKSARVQRALAALPESYRLVIELRNFQRRSFKDIAGIMQRSPDAVRKLWCRGIEILVQELAGDESTGT